MITSVCALFCIMYSETTKPIRYQYDQKHYGSWIVDYARTMADRMSERLAF